MHLGQEHDILRKKRTIFTINTKSKLNHEIFGQEYVKLRKKNIFKKQKINPKENGHEQPQRRKTFQAEEQDLGGPHRRRAAHLETPTGFAIWASGAPLSVAAGGKERHQKTARKMNKKKKRYPLARSWPWR